MFTSLYFFGVRVAGLFNAKARKLALGEHRTLESIAERVEKGERYVWFHAASVGEFEQGRPVIERIKREHPEKKIILTFFSPSGYELRKHYPLADIVAYLPFATRSKARRFVELVRPEMAVFIKYEFWPNYLKELHRQGVATYIIAATFRKKQAFFHWYGKGYRKCLTYFKHLFVQDDASARLLAEYGVRNVTVCGDPRFDRVSAIAKEAKQLPIIEQFCHDSLTLVAGSTWPADEDLLVRYLKSESRCKLILVPHETDKHHLYRIYQMLRGKYVRYTEATPQNLENARCLVVDTMGILSSIYRYGTVAYVGGGFGAGIHNTIEAAVYGLPVVFGPRHEKFREANELIACKGGLAVKDYDTLKSALAEAFAHRDEYGANARRYVADNCGATEVIYTHLFN